MEKSRRLIQRWNTNVKSEDEAKKKNDDFKLCLETLEKKKMSLVNHEIVIKIQT